MPDTIGERLKRTWNAFMNKDPTEDYTYQFGQSFSSRPDKQNAFRSTERTFVNAIYNRIAIDVAAIKINHVRLDKDDKFDEIIKGPLNDRLNLSANLDQTGRAFIQDAVMQMFHEGTIAIAPIDTEDDPEDTESTTIYSWRCGKITKWYPDAVQIDLYDQRTGKHQELRFKKSAVAIIENPLFPVMNEPNSTLKRLIRKINLMDIMDEQTGSGKMDLIIQLPYVIKSPAMEAKAKARRISIENQLANSKYGIAYIDGTEKVTQLNRSLENNLAKSVQDLTNDLFNQLGMTKEIFDGTADEKHMINYYNRTIEPILSSLTDEFIRKFLSKTARSQGQSIMFFRDPFKLVPVEQIADIADKFTRNEIVSPNEMRQAIGMRKSSDPKSNELRNRNISESSEARDESNPEPKDSENQNNLENLPFENM